MQTAEPDTPSVAPVDVDKFIDKWSRSGAAERANYQLFLTELCALIDVPGPDPTQDDDRENSYVFERSVKITNLDGSENQGWIDLYKQGCFVLEAKQGSDKLETKKDGMAILAEKKRKRKTGTAVRGTGRWDRAMRAAFTQAEQYARALPTDEGWPPFVVVVDVGYVIELFSDFSRSGKTYVQFPDPPNYRITLDDLRRDFSVGMRRVDRWRVRRLCKKMDPMYRSRMFRAECECSGPRRLTMS